MEPSTVVPNLPAKRLCSLSRTTTQPCAWSPGSTADNTGFARLWSLPAEPSSAIPEIHSTMERWAMLCSN